jgi:hypothetical protein
MTRTKQNALIVRKWAYRITQQCRRCAHETHHATKSASVGVFRDLTDIRGDYRVDAPHTKTQEQSAEVVQIDVCGKSENQVGDDHGDGYNQQCLLSSDSIHHRY